MKKSFTIGVVTGISALALAVPVLAQVSSAQTTTPTQTSSATSVMKPWKHGKPDTTKAGIQAMIAHDDAFLTNIDAFVSVQKSVMQSHRAALAAAALLTDDAVRAAAVQKANEDMRTAMQAAMTANPALKGMMPFGGGRGHGGFGKKGMHPSMMGRGNGNDKNDVAPVTPQ